jgi:hypothetical protein
MLQSRIIVVLVRFEKLTAPQHVPFVLSPDRFQVARLFATGNNSELGFLHFLNVFGLLGYRKIASGHPWLLPCTPKDELGKRMSWRARVRLSISPGTKPCSSSKFPISNVNYVPKTSTDKDDDKQHECSPKTTYPIPMWRCLQALSLISMMSICKLTEMMFNIACRSSLLQLSTAYAAVYL